MLQDKQLPSEAIGLPAVMLDAEGVTAWLGDEACCILWSQITLVKIGIVGATDLDYAEAFWLLTGEGVEFIAPVEVIVNADLLRDRLFMLPGFDMEMYRRAREAEAQGELREFICWRKGNA